MRVGTLPFIQIGLLAGVALATVSPRPAFAGGGGETLKERLSDKASDEQRVDNCKVPLNRRGVKPRPDCAAARPEGAS
jgi:hypothetical protein